ncbi:MULTISPECIES: hypothetical protein [Aeromonas]|uniref:hypothetical protein n=1 Tax=Aeromonas TaxID=642 RepID=UPI0007B5BEBC|nr:MULTISPECIES: hypothetical protein [Aeromonas]ANB69424.1 hypothetical protein A6033_13330 [Aeromonas veronii]QWZ82375.1 hypothetical protein I6L44_05540 [Aeromonas sp. FDAARGOS 1414]
MGTSEQSDPLGQAKSRYDPALPTGYDWRRHRRFILSGGGYKAECSRRNWFLELLNPVPYVVVRDIAIGGIGILGAIRLKEGDELVIAIPSGEMLRGLVVRSQPDPLFPKLYRTGIRLHRYPTAELFARWQSYIQPQDKADFDHECQVLKQIRGA